MKKQIWTLKQFLFEKDLNGHRTFYIDGFQIQDSEDHRFLLETLEELYKVYGDRFRQYNLDLIRHLVDKKTCYAEIVYREIPSAPSLKYELSLNTNGLDYYPEEQGVYYADGKFSIDKRGRLTLHKTKKGLHIHKSRLSLSNQEGDIE